MIGKIFTIFCVFSYIYAIHYVYLPFNFPFLLGIIGVGISMINPNLFKYHKEKWIDLSKYVYPMIPLLIFTVFSLELNGTNDIYFIKWCIINVLYFFGAYVIVQIIEKYYNQVDFHLLVRLITIAAVIQSFLALTKYLSPVADNFLSMFINVDGGVGEKLQFNLGKRLVGFGTQFFRAGTTQSFVLILIAFEAVCNTKKYFYIYMISFLFIFVVGIMMARTTLVGALIGILVLFCYHISDFKKLFRLICQIVLLIVLVYILSRFLPSGIVTDLDLALQFGFELFINYFDSGTFSSISTDHMFEDMYVWPENLSTWIYGDGYYDDPSGDGYYMHTDVGYVRLLYYFGIIGEFLFFLSNLKICIRTFPPLLFGKNMWMFFFAFLLIINSKGTFDLFLFLSLFFFARNTNVFFINSNGFEENCNNI